MSESRYSIVALCVLSLCLSLTYKVRSEEVPVPDPERLEKRVFEYHRALQARDFKRAYKIWAPYMRHLPWREWKKQYKDVPPYQLDDLRMKVADCGYVEGPVVRCGIRVLTRITSEGATHIGELYESWEYIRGKWYFGLFLGATEESQYVEQDPERRAQEEQRRGAESKKRRQAEAAAPNCLATLAPGAVCRDSLEDGSQGPVMVVISPGSFMMGSPESEQGRREWEGPQHQVTVGKFAIGRYEVTFEEYDRFVEATGRERPDDKGWGRGDRPVINVSWDDAVAYADWLAEQTGERYRLPTEAEWEYAVRAGTEASYWWGGGQVRENCADCDDRWDDRTAPVGSFDANAFGLLDVSGNVSEWVQDCWHDDFWGAPADGSSWEVEPGGDCGRRVLRGGAWSTRRGSLRSAYRFGVTPGARMYRLGLRLARDL